jgi:hypothetical protein
MHDVNPSLEQRRKVEPLLRLSEVACGVSGATTTREGQRMIASLSLCLTAPSEQVLG